MHTARDQLSAAKVGTFYNVVIIMSENPWLFLPPPPPLFLFFFFFPIDLSIYLSFKTNLHSKGFGQYVIENNSHLWSKKMNADWKGVEKDCKDCRNKDLSVLSRHSEGWGVRVAIHTCSIKASIREKTGAFLQENTVTKQKAKAGHE